jgi:hypothetical protein
MHGQKCSSNQICDYQRVGKIRVYKCSMETTFQLATMETNTTLIITIVPNIEKYISDVNI